MLTIRNFIDGKHVDAVSGQFFDKIDPATGAVVARVPDSDGRDVEEAVQAAARAFPRWARTPVAERHTPPARRRGTHRAGSRPPGPCRVRGYRQTLATRPRRGHPEGGQQFSLLRHRHPAFPLRGVSHRSGGPQLHAAAAARRGRTYRAVEPAAVSSELEDRAGAGGGKYRRRQAVGTDADHGPSADRDMSAGRTCRRACSTWFTATARRSGRPSSPIRACRPSRSPAAPPPARRSAGPRRRTSKRSPSNSAARTPTSSSPTPTSTKS